jgi:hypothetical protein
VTKLSMSAVVVAAVITGVVIGVGAGFTREHWFGGGNQESPPITAEIAVPNRFPDGSGINPGDFIDLAEAEGGAAALESFISSGFGAGGPDPDSLRARLRGFGMEVSDDATTEDMLEMLANAAETIFPAPPE